MISHRKVATLLSVLLALAFAKCWGQEKINGISFVGTSTPVTSAMLDPVCSTNANWITLMPFAYGRKDSEELKHKNLTWQWWGESAEGVKATIEIAHERGLKVMIKPQIWLRHGVYTGHLDVETESNWQTFEKAYREYILQYAQISQDNNLPLFCIGTELTIFAAEREAFWRDLIQEIRTIYSGKLTYAANWDSWLKIPFWDQLDYVGIDAYFPLCSQQTPTLKTLMKSWEPHFNSIQKKSQQWDKPIIFTEWGYRSMDYCAREPWVYDEDEKTNTQAQYNAYLALFKQFWHQPWFAGGFVWKWFPNHQDVGGTNNNNFTPQNKPVEQLMQEWFGNYN